jgi:hypothetical protein
MVSRATALADRGGVAPYVCAGCAVRAARRRLRGGAKRSASVAVYRPTDSRCKEKPHGSMNATFYRTWETDRLLSSGGCGRRLLWRLDVASRRCGVGRCGAVVAVASELLVRSQRLPHSSESTVTAPKRSKVIGSRASTPRRECLRFSGRRGKSWDILTSVIGNHASTPSQNKSPQLHLLISTTAQLPENRTPRCLELLRAAEVLTDDLLKQQS